MMCLGLLCCGIAAGPACAATLPVPSRCTAGVNATLAAFLTAHGNGGAEADQDNVMVCGTALRDAIAQHAGHSGTGAHRVLVLAAPVAGGGTVTIEVVTNDQLDGVVAARTGDLVYAFGQAFYDGRPLRAGGLSVSAGVHDTHCSTHAGADDGWVVVAGVRYPRQGCRGAR